MDHDEMMTDQVTFPSPLRHNNKRSAHDLITSSSLCVRQKKKKIWNQRESLDVEPILAKVLRWLNSVNTSQLPKSINELEQNITSICHVKIRIDTTVLFYHLLLNNVLVFDGNNKFLPNPHYNINSRSFVGFVLDDTAANHSIFSPEFCESFYAAAKWIMKYQTSLTYEELWVGLESLSKYEFKVSSASVIELLVQKGYVELQPPLQVNYYLPQHPPSSGDLRVLPHYRPGYL